MNEISGAGFQDVDRTGDPGARVSYLDAITAQALAGNYKRRTFELMAINPGDTVLDVGCGTGEDLRELATLVGATGRVVGIDRSETMVHEARLRTELLPVECHLGDAHQLEFAEHTFDACRSDRVFQHLDRPQAAFAELMRVAKSGAHIVVVDPDWDTLVVDATDRLLTRLIVSRVSELARNPSMGRMLYALAHDCGLLDLTVEASTLIISDWLLARQLFGLGYALERGVSSRAIAEHEAAAWIREMEERSAAGAFFSAGTTFVVCGRNP